MDWKSDDLLFGAEIEEFRTEKTVKADKVTVSPSLIIFSTLAQLHVSRSELTLSNPESNISELLGHFACYCRPCAYQGWKAVSMQMACY